MFSALLFLLTSLACVSFANLIKNDRVRIIDIVHENIYLNQPYISDVLILLQVLFAIAVMEQPEFSEGCLIMSVVQILRVICSCSTVLPPLKNYHDKYRIGGINGNGTEYIFSGHASYSCLTSLYLFKKGYNPIYLLLYNFVSQNMIVITRNHYTVDVVLAWIIVPLVYIALQYCYLTDVCNRQISLFLK